MDKRLIAGILVFGSLWGFSEVIIGTGLQNAGLPYGAIMTGVFALSFLVLSRMIFRQPGMQMGMGLIAGGLRIFNPFIGCHLCSAIAIMAEAAIFEIIWYKMESDFSDLKTITMQSSIGITTAYLVYIGGYITTQILTPIVGGTGFYLENLIVFMPRILASGLLTALLGAVALPAILQLKKLDLTIKYRLYYPATVGISILCWIAVIASSIIGS
ncbi:MAG: hypothetical protein DRO67_10185 [Candidatus Asgardarchaeum californiense]|nr:MAG: hypothetical protein DRO67_10185 [Candidatus Asgardarchaeum californiense]